MHIRRRYLLLATVAPLACQDSVCLHPPCPEPFALELTVTAAATGAPVLATVAITSPIVTTFQCGGTCPVAGPAGKYEVDVTAPGFAPVHRSVQVKGNEPDCGCASAETEHVAIALVATP
jgi:hypothetical protein